MKRIIPISGFCWPVLMPKSEITIQTILSKHYETFTRKKSSYRRQTARRMRLRWNCMAWSSRGPICQSSAWQNLE